MIERRDIGVVEEEIMRCIQIEELNIPKLSKKQEELIRVNREYNSEARSDYYYYDEELDYILNFSE